MTQNTSLTLSAAELVEVTGGYTRPADQLRVLHSRGFVRAAILKGQLVLERSHYTAVCSGQYGLRPGESDRPRPMLTSQRLRAASKR